MSDEDGFLSRWSRRKAAVREGAVLPSEAPPPALRPAPGERPLEPAAASAVQAQAPVRAELVEAPPPPEPPADPPPTLDDVARLGRGSDFRRFVAADVDPAVKNAALKKLFADPQFNVMDGLDVYIDDYGKPDPLPASMLRKMVQSAALGLFRDEPRTEPPPAEPPADDQDPAVRLQPDDAAGPSGAERGPAADPGRER